jgi:hypothetical protein
MSRDPDPAATSRVPLVGIPPAAKKRIRAAERKKSAVARRLDAEAEAAFLGVKEALAPPGSVPCDGCGAPVHVFERLERIVGELRVDPFPAVPVLLGHGHATCARKMRAAA